MERERRIGGGEERQEKKKKLFSVQGSVNHM